MPIDNIKWTIFLYQRKVSSQQDTSLVVKKWWGNFLPEGMNYHWKSTKPPTRGKFSAPSFSKKMCFILSLHDHSRMSVTRSAIDHWLVVRLEQEFQGLQGWQILSRYNSHLHNRLILKQEYVSISSQSSIFCLQWWPKTGGLSYSSQIHW